MKLKSLYWIILLILLVCNPILFVVIIIFIYLMYENR